jgi:hypothetical protein
MSNEYQILGLIVEFEAELNELPIDVRLDVTQAFIDWLEKYQDGIK